MTVQRTFDEETYKKIGSPQIRATVFYIHPKTKKKVYAEVVGVHYSRKGVTLTLDPHKFHKRNNS